MPALHSDTPVKSTIAKIAAGAISLATAVWFVRGAVENYQTAVTARMDKIDAKLAAIDAFMRHEAVTQSQAERYAAAFRWENRDIRIVVPEPILYQDKPKS